MTNEKRIETEQRIVHNYIKALQSVGYIPRRMYNGDEWEAYDQAEIFAANECTIVFIHPVFERCTLWFVYGNAPGEVLSDCTTNANPWIAEVNKYAEGYC